MIYIFCNWVSVTEPYTTVFNRLNVNIIQNIEIISWVFVNELTMNMMSAIHGNLLGSSTHFIKSFVHSFE